MLALLFVLAAAPLVLLVGVGGRRLRHPQGYSEDVRQGVLPQVGLVVPVKGVRHGTRECLQALLRQDHPRHEVVFVVEKEDDPATEMIREALAEAKEKGRGIGRLVVAGVAEQCGQKNRNQLAGVAALGQGVDILAFCDSTHLPRPDWLRRLVTPIADGRAEASTAYHHVFMETRGLAAVGRCVSVLALYMMQEIPAVTQPWGGSMAIRRATFEKLGIAALWSTNVVDDVSLARRLEDCGLRAAPVLGARLDTFLASETFTGWRVWLERQWLYLKFIYPGSWLAVGIVLYLQALLLALGGAAALLGPFGLFGAGLTTAGWAYLLLLVVLGLWARECHPRPPGRGLWLAGFFATLFMAALSHMRTLGLGVIPWGGIVYSVGRGGEVLALRRGE